MFAVANHLFNIIALKCFMGAEMTFHCHLTSSEIARFER